MEEIISGSVYFGLALTCGAYVAGCVVHKAAKTPLLNPLIVTNVLVIAFLAVTGISYESYFKGARYIGDLLTPATVCLAIPLYRQLHLLKKHAAAIFCGIAAGVLANGWGCCSWVEVVRVRTILISWRCGIWVRRVSVRMRTLVVRRREQPMSQQRGSEVGPRMEYASVAARYWASTSAATAVWVSMRYP